MFPSRTIQCKWVCIVSLSMDRYIYARTFFYSGKKNVKNCIIIDDDIRMTYPLIATNVVWSKCLPTERPLFQKRRRKKTRKESKKKNTNFKWGYDQRHNLALNYLAIKLYNRKVFQHNSYTNAFRENRKNRKNSFARKSNFSFLYYSCIYIHHTYNVYCLIAGCSF